MVSRRRYLGTSRIFKRRPDNNPFHTTHLLTYVHHRPDDRVYFTYCYPYTFTNVIDHLRSLAPWERAGILLVESTMAGTLFRC